MPADLALTGQVPDIVLVEREARRVVLLELTCPFDTARAMNDAMSRKQERYQMLAEDIHLKGYTVHNMPFEIGARGFVNDNFGVLASLSAMCKIRNVKNLRQNLGRIALLGSYRI